MDLSNEKYGKMVQEMSRMQDLEQFFVSDGIVFFISPTLKVLKALYMYDRHLSLHNIYIHCRKIYIYLCKILKWIEKLTFGAYSVTSSCYHPS